MGYVSEFSPDCKLFALIDCDGKLKFWNVKANELSQEYVLSGLYTCLLWIGTDSKVVGKNNTWHIALGTSKGGVEVYSYSERTIKFQLLGDTHTGGVTSICLQKNSTLYTCGEDCRIISWSLSTGLKLRAWSSGTERPTFIVSLPKTNRLLVGCKELKLWSTTTHELEYTFTGHTSEVSSLTTLLVNCNQRNEEFALSTAKNSREFSLWRMEASSKYKNPRATFLTKRKHAPICISSVIVGNKITIAVVISTGHLHLYFIDDIMNILVDHMKPSKPKLSIKLESDLLQTPSPIPIVKVVLAPQGIDAILICYSNSKSLRFENVKYNSAKQDVDIQLIGQETTKQNTEIRSPRKRKSTAKIEVPRKICRKLSGEKCELEYALKNQDFDYLRQVFTDQDENRVLSRLKTLPTQYIPDLVDAMTILMQKNASDVQQEVLCWLKILLETRSNQLIAMEKAELLFNLSAVIEQKTKILQPLLKISGQLDMLLSQVKHNTYGNSSCNNDTDL